MAMDNRDWYVDSQRKKQGYTERAAFRVSLGQQERSRRFKRALYGWATLALYAALLVAVLAFLAVALRTVVLPKVAPAYSAIRAEGCGIGGAPACGEVS